MTGGGPGREYSAHTATPETVAAASKRVTGSTKAPGGVESTASTNKYRNTPAFGPDPCGGTRHYASKREARRAEALSAAKRGGHIADYFPQVSIPYGVDETGKSLRYVADFLVVQEYRADGSFVGWLEDPKGYATDTSKAKMAALRARGLSVRTI